jgi:transcriptional regulator with XRE-family HTH domain
MTAELPATHPIRYLPQRRFAEVTFPSLRAELARRGMTQNDMARILGCSQGHISARMAGRAPWRVSDLAKIARYMGVPLAVILDDDPVEDDSEAGR